MTITADNSNQTSRRRFLYFSAVCAFLTGFTTIAIHQIKFPVGSFEQNLQLYRNQSYLTLHWTILVHCFLVLCSMLGMALVLVPRAKPLAILGFLFFAVFVFTEWQRTFGVLWHINGLRQQYLATTNAETQVFLRYEIQHRLFQSGSQFLLFVAAFTLGNASFGAALVGRKGVDRWLGAGLLLWAVCTSVAFVHELSPVNWMESIVEACNKIYQPLIRFAIAYWLVLAVRRERVVAGDDSPVALAFRRV